MTTRFIASNSAYPSGKFNGAGRKGTSFTNIFSGIAKCAYCGSPMKFENKGPRPKGGTFLVCDGARRGLGCEIARWRYDDSRHRSLRS